MLAQLLGRFFGVLRAHNPALSGDRKKYTIVPPQVARDGSKKTSFSNIIDICKRMHRQPEHVIQYLYAELGTVGSIDGSQRLIIKGRFQPKQIENVLRRYIVEYVTCKTCKSPNTSLLKDNRIYFIKCAACGSQRSVSAIKTGFQAQTGKREWSAAARRGQYDEERVADRVSPLCTHRLEDACPGCSIDARRGAFTIAVELDGRRGVRRLTVAAHLAPSIHLANLLLYSRERFNDDSLLLRDHKPMLDIVLALARDARLVDEVAALGAVQACRADRTSLPRLLLRLTSVYASLCLHSPASPAHPCKILCATLSLSVEYALMMAVTGGRVMRSATRSQRVCVALSYTHSAR